MIRSCARKCLRIERDMGDWAIMEVFGGPADGLDFDFFAAYGKPPVAGDLVTHLSPWCAGQSFVSSGGVGRGRI